MLHPLLASVRAIALFTTKTNVIVGVLNNFQPSNMVSGCSLFYVLCFTLCKFSYSYAIDYIE